MSSHAMSPIEIVIHGRHAQVSDRFKNHVNEKLERIAKFAIRVARVDVEVSHEANPRQHDRAYEVELTCHGAGSFIRTEAHAVDKYTALDLAYTRLEERLRRMHERTKAVRHSRPEPELGMTEAAEMIDEFADTFEAVFDGIVYENGPLVVRTKNIQSEPMSIEQAVEAMELVGHDFFLFKNQENGCSSVLYRRRGYDFGLIQLQ